VSLKLIWEPITIGNVTIRNRIVRSAHGTNIGWGQITEDLIAYHVARAKGGVGLTTLEFCMVHLSSFLNGLRSYDDSIVEGYRKLMAAIAPHGMTVFQQLGHGGCMYPGLDGVAWSSSNTPNPISGLVPMEMSKDQIAEITGAFVAAASRCVQGGIQGIELHFGHGYLFHQFFSPLMNHRSDEYGGSFDNRMRFGREVLRAVKAVLPENYPLGIRASDQFAPGGNNADDTATMVAELEEEGLINFVTASQGSYYTLPEMLPAMDKPLGTMFPSSSTVVAGARKAARILTPGRVRTLEEAEQMLRQNLGDMIVLQRAFIADPELAIKTRAGRIDEIRPCIACNQGCVGGLLSPANRIGCAVNPAAGFERELDESLLVKTSNPRKVLVVGGGPGGMEAARVAALCGHKVVLAEAGARLGGLINVAKLAPFLHSIGDFTQWQENELYRLGVEVRTNTYMEVEEIRAERADVVIIATGAMPRMDGIQFKLPGIPAQGVDKPHVVSSVDVLTGAYKNPGRSALVFDDVGSYESIAVTEHLIDKGLSVTFATGFAQFAPIAEMWTRASPALDRINKGRFKLLTRMHLTEVRQGECELTALHGDVRETVPADTVVLILSREPMPAFYQELRDAHIDFVLVGDAKAPRDFQAAVREGHLAVRSIR
jgi:2,4-dienoyl-CoA reductase-like NADH-dependent reductase (Old Yellow Enzyme family)